MMKRFLVSTVLLVLVGCAQALVLGSTKDAPLATASISQYPLSILDVANPERGFYFHPGDCDTNALSSSVLAAKRAGEDKISLVLCIFYLKEYTDKPLPPDETPGGPIAKFRERADAVRAAGLKMIVRFAYSDVEVEDPSCVDKSDCDRKRTGLDAPVDLVIHHIGQLTDALQDNQDIIAAVESGFVGTWGEGHYSMNFGNHGNTRLDDGSLIPDTLEGKELRKENWDNRKRVVDALLGILPNRMVLVRTPRMKDAMYPVGIAGRTRVGHHNDCFLASETDGGTWVEQYGPYDPSTELTLLNPPRDSSGKPVDSDEHKNLALDTESVAMGGETCLHHARSNAETALYELPKFHYSYLNRTGNATAIMPGGEEVSVPDTWDSNSLDTIKKSLGYRFLLRSSSFPPSVFVGALLPVKIGIVNIGWATPFNYRPVYLVLRNKTTPSIVYKLKLTADPRKWYTQGTIDENVRLPSTLLPGVYQLLLWLPEPSRAILGRPEPTWSLHNRPEYAIRMANGVVWDTQKINQETKETGFNRLMNVRFNWAAGRFERVLTTIQVKQPLAPN